MKARLSEFDCPKDCQLKDNSSIPIEYDIDGLLKLKQVDDFFLGKFGDPFRHIAA